MPLGCGNWETKPVIIDCVPDFNAKNAGELGLTTGWRPGLSGPNPVVSSYHKATGEETGGKLPEYDLLWPLMWKRKLKQAWWLGCLPFSRDLWSLPGRAEEPAHAVTVHILRQYGGGHSGP